MERAEWVEWQRERQDWGHELEPGSGMERGHGGHGAMSHGHVHGGGGESGEGGAGGHESSDRGMKSRSHDRRGVWVVAAMWDPGAMSWSGVEGSMGPRGHGKGAWGERGGRSGRACIGALSSHLIGAWGHGAMGRVHGGGGCVGGGSHVRHGVMSWSP